MWWNFSIERWIPEGKALFSPFEHSPSKEVSRHAHHG